MKASPQFKKVYKDEVYRLLTELIDEAIDFRERMILVVSDPDLKHHTAIISAKELALHSVRRVLRNHLEGLDAVQGVIDILDDLSDMDDMAI